MDQLLGFRHDPSLRRQEEVRGRPCGGYLLRTRQRRSAPVEDQVPSLASGERLSSSASAVLRAGRQASPPFAATGSGYQGSPMSPFRNPASPQEFNPPEVSTPGPGPDSPSDIFRDSVEVSLPPDDLSSLSLDTAPGGQFGPGYEGELMNVVLTKIRNYLFYLDLGSSDASAATTNSTLEWLEDNWVQLAVGTSAAAVFLLALGSSSRLRTGCVRLVQLAAYASAAAVFLAALVTTSTFRQAISCLRRAFGGQEDDDPGADDVGLQGGAPGAGQGTPPPRGQDTD